jgi:hypothetical protein
VTEKSNLILRSAQLKIVSSIWSSITATTSSALDFRVKCRHLVILVRVYPVHVKSSSAVVN